MKAAVVVTMVMLAVMIVAILVVMALFPPAKFDLDVRPVYGSAQSGPAYLG